MRFAPAEEWDIEVFAIWNFRALSENGKGFLFPRFETAKILNKE